ncbi:hypothetical protein FACS1894102_3540 [Spirochaetia bacterium]|nr:hypothetical protein FACS1894102_3540 [Spirochaetia bacterium]
MEDKFTLSESQQMAFDYFKGQGFLPVDKSAYPIMKKYDGGDNLLGEMTATVAVIWGLEYYALYKVIGGYMCSIWFLRHDSDYYFEVNRPAKPEYPLADLINNLYMQIKAAGLDELHIYAVNEENLPDFCSVQGYDIHTEYSDDHSEFFYKTEDLINLSGGINANKRSRLKHCFALTDISIVPITKENVALALDIQDAWCEHQECEYCASFAGCERKAIEVMVSIFDEKEKAGLLLYQKDVPVGYIICEQINDIVSYVYQGKAIINDFFVYLIYIMYKDYHKDVKYMDLNEDMGHEGIRMFKRHLSAYELWRKYLLTYKKKEGEN